MEWLSDERVLLSLANKMPYGKYRGRRIIDIPEPYLVWLARTGFPPVHLVKRWRWPMKSSSTGWNP